LVIVVAIITGFVALTPLRYVGAKDPIPTADGCTAATAAILIHRVAIVTGFIALVFWRKILTDHAIATKGRLTTVGTGVCVVFIAIVAGFTDLQTAVATRGFDFTDHDFGTAAGDQEEGHEGE
tara:strand:+ start:436 stop:804 length:369 start_codon:yes stop_codon:yes gene_type:complete